MNDAIRIPIRKKGKVVAHALVDPADTDLAALPWRMSPDGYAVCSLYRKPEGNKAMHSFVIERSCGRLPVYRKEHSDHINRDRLDNRRTNLRIATPSINAANRTCGGRRVSWNIRSKKWLVYMQRDGVIHYGGGYLTKREAVRVADSLFEKLWPELKGTK